jgi:uncharacterized membrane protein
VHHRLFETLRAFDGRLMTLNLAFLALIVLVPFGTELYDRYSGEPVAAAVFGAIMGLAALTHWSMSAHTLSRGYVDESARAERLPLARPADLGLTALFLVSVPLAFLSTTVAALVWTATILLHLPLARRR